MRILFSKALTGKFNTFFILPSFEPGEDGVKKIYYIYDKMRAATLMAV
jgi:hypothetical protein